MRKQLLYYLMPIVKLVVFIICVIVCSLPVGALQWIPGIKDLDEVYTMIITEPLLMISIFAALFFMTKIYKPTTISSFFLSKKNAFKEVLSGTLMGMIILLVCGGLLLLQGFVVFSPGKISLAFFLFYILYFLIVAVFEELFSRTYQLFVLAETYPIAIAVVVNGLIFGLLHSLNPGFTALALINISLAGMLFSLFTLYHRSINWAIGMHLGWNFTQGILLGYKVSGSDTPGVLVAKPIGENYFSGGTFGVEGSLSCTLVLILLIIYLAFKFTIKPLKQHVL
ncbi:CPBP family intramembrane glutamic endopeptidase [Pedobacter sp. Du54]|uniref:CPBP family intramembrane glutamic endopeptidase n=1 Tax=Pedobacter anseongensis TaxID=3133439 RepID=UPI0030A71489